MNFRISTFGDLKGLKTLWELAFHDSEDYIDNFFDSYGSSDKIIVAEEDGNIIGMTAWFGSTFRRGDDHFRFAYLYAVATHPDYQSKGIASHLLRYVYLYMKNLGFHGVTTVPAEESLHHFFAKNGFKDYFVHKKSSLLYTTMSYSPDMKTIKLSAEEYKYLRDASFAHIKYKETNFAQSQNQTPPLMPYITLDIEGYAYQESVCNFSGGGFYWIGRGTPFDRDHPKEKPYQSSDPHWQSGVLCTLERSAPNHFLIKERITWHPLNLRDSPRHIWQVASNQGAKANNAMECRSPLFEPHRSLVNFGMIQWLTPPPQDWHPTKTGEMGYLGLAFD